MKNRLRDLREDKDLYQIDIAKIFNISQSNYSKYELGAINIPIELLKRFAIFYNVSIDYILCLIDRPRALYNKPNREQIKNQQIIKNSKHFTINNN